jgi:hypothetical protein
MDRALSLNLRSDDDIARGSISPLGRSVAPRSRPFAGTLIAGLAPEVLREDASFHAYQML